jgi:hypothetical protein
MFSINEPMPNTWVHHRLNLKPYKYLRLRIIKRQGTNPQVSMVESHKLQSQRIKLTSFKGSSLQAHKLQRFKLTSFKGLSPQAYKLQRYIPQTSKA